MISQEQAAQVAAPYLAKEENTTVHVNQHGLIWVNNEKEHMEKYFSVKKEKFWVFEKEGTEPQAEPQGEAKPKKGKK